MLFNSLNFLLFFPIVTTIYYSIPEKYKRVFLLVSSYFFYMSWIPHYILLILFSTLVDFTAASKIQNLQKPFGRKCWLLTSLIANLGILFTFKYYNFFNNFVYDLFEIKPLPYLNILLPVGISFYTFQTISYTVDVYKNKIKPEKNLINFALYVSYFPQLVAGPIERASHLLPQLKATRHFNYERTISGIYQISWGLFLKVVLADNLAPFVDSIFNSPGSHNGMASLLASYFFAFQIYGDFAGYSLIAIGCSNVLGINLMKNFSAPYHSLSVTEFWRRWHISLSTWFKDYVYIPLGGSRKTKARTLFNLFIVFLISGLWHGANYNFLIWGTIHGTIVCLEKMIGFDRNFQPNRAITFLRKLLVFHIIVFAWIFFRSDNLDISWRIIKNIAFNTDFQSLLQEKYIRIEQLSLYLLVIMIVFSFDYFTEIKRVPWKNQLRSLPIFFRWSIYIIFTITLLILGRWNSSSFIYFQF